MKASEFLRSLDSEADKLTRQRCPAGRRCALFAVSVMGTFQQSDSDSQIVEGETMFTWECGDEDECVLTAESILSIMKDAVEETYTKLKLVGEIKPTV